MFPIYLRRPDSRSSIHPRISSSDPHGFSRLVIQAFVLYAAQTIEKSAFSSTVMLNSSKTCNRPQQFSMNLVVSLLTQIHPGRITEGPYCELASLSGCQRAITLIPSGALRFLEAFSSYRVQIALGLAASQLPVQQVSRK